MLLLENFQDIKFDILLLQKRGGSFLSLPAELAARSLPFQMLAVRSMLCIVFLIEQAREY